VRPGLVAVGVGFLVLAAGALVTVNLLPAPTAPEQDQFTLAPVVVEPGASGAAMIPGTVSPSGHLVIAWSTDGYLRLQLFPEGACPTGIHSCAGSEEIANWSGVSGSQWSIQGPQQFPYEMVWFTNATAPFNFTASAEETWSSTQASTGWQSLLIDAVAVALGVVGAVSLFLGLFLRGGVYRGPPPIISRSADDVHDPYPAPPPR
jgi:hypothetical protein